VTLVCKAVAEILITINVSKTFRVKKRDEFVVISNKLTNKRRVQSLHSLGGTEDNYDIHSDRVLKHVQPVTFQVLKASMKMPASWDTVP
jgi:hypothetical protein